MAVDILESIDGTKGFDLSEPTSRVFRSLGGGWRQLHHHGFVDDAAPLERYQSAVR